MLNWLRRMVNPPRRRALEAAGTGRRWPDGAGIKNLNAEIMAGNKIIARRAAGITLNNSYGASGSDAFVRNLVGNGILPQSRHPDPQARAAIDDAFDRWSPFADAAGLTSFPGLQSMIARGLATPGEAFLRYRVRRRGDRLDVPFQLEMLAPEQIDSALHRDLANGVRIRAGVEFDVDGRRVAFHVLPQRPGDPLAGSFAPVRIPAAEMIHVFEPIVPGQVRGVSRFAPILTKLYDLDAYEDAELMRKKIAALFAGFVSPGVNDDGTPLVSETPDNKGNAEITLEPGGMQVLRPGASITFSEPAEVGTSFEPFMKSQLHAIAAGLGVTYEQLTGDMTGVNFSSARVALIEFRRRIEALQQQVLIHQFCRPVWDRFIHVAVLSGALNAPGFERDPRPWLAVKWTPPAWAYVDPLKELQAEKLAVDSHFKSRADVVASRGRSLEQVDKEIAADAHPAAPAAPQEGDRENADD